MKIKNIQQYRTLYKTVIRDLPSRDENFIGNYLIDESSNKKKFGWFEIYHGDKEGYGKAEAGIENFLQSFLDMAKDGQAVYEFLQNAVDAQSSHFTMIWDRDPIDGNYYLLVANNGEMFDGDSIRSILNVGSSTKTADSETIGKFGIGFKLAHRLVGKDNGLQELINENSGPILFSWKNYEIENIANAENLEPTEIDYNLNEKGNLNILDNNPWLFKILITCFPCLPENNSIQEFPIMANGNLAEINPFDKVEYEVLSRWIKKYQHILNKDTYNEGALFFIKLGSGKESELDEINLKEGVKFSLAILKETADLEADKTQNLLQTVQLKNEEPITYPELEYVKFTVDKNYEKDTYAYIRFGKSTYEDLLPEQKNRLKEEANIEVLFGFRKHNQIENYFKGAPNLYLYFPLSEEVHNFNYVLHSNAFYKGSSRTFLHKGSGEDGGINERLLKIIVDKIDEELERLSNSTIETERQLFLHFYAALLTSNKSANEDRLWIETPYINPVNELLKKYIPVKVSLNSDEFITTSHPEEVFIKKTKIEIDPTSWGIENVNWFYWSDDNIKCLIGGYNKLDIEDFDVYSLLSFDDKISELVNLWLSKDIQNIELILSELKLIDEKNVSETIFKNNLFNLNIIDFSTNDFNEILSINEFQEKEIEGYFILYNKLNDIKDLLYKLGLKLTIKNFEVYNFPEKYFRLFNNESQVKNYNILTNLFSGVVSDDALNLLTFNEKHRVYEAFRTLNDRPGDRMKDLKLFKNNNNNPVRFKNLYSDSQKDWLVKFCINNSENNAAYKNYLLNKEEDIYEGIIVPFWDEILNYIAKNKEEVKGVLEDIISLYEQSTWIQKGANQLDDSNLIIFKDEVIEAASIYFNERLYTLSDEDYQNIQDTVLKHYNTHIPDSYILPYIDKEPFSYVSVTINPNLEDSTLNKTDLHNLLLFSKVCNIDFFSNNCVTEKDGKYYIDPANKKQQISTSKAVIIKYVESYYPDDFELISDDFLMFKSSIELSESKLVEHLVDIFKEVNDDQKLDLIELVSAERLQDKQALLEKLTYTPLDATWINKRSNGLYLKLLKDVVESEITAEQLQEIHDKIKISNDELEINVGEIDSAQDSIELMRGEIKIIVSQSQILNLENAESIKLIQDFHDEAKKRDLLNQNIADNLFKISNTGVTDQLVTKFLESLTNKQIENTHQLLFVWLSNKFDKDRFNEFSIKRQDEQWDKLSGQYLFYSEQNLKYISKLYMFSDNYINIQSLLQLSDLEAFSYGLEEDDIVASKFLFVKGFNIDPLNDEQPLTDKLNYLYSGWLNLSPQIRIPKRKQDWKKYLGITPNEFIIKGIRTNLEDLPIDFNVWANNENSKIKFLSDLGFWKGENPIQELRSFLSGESNSISEDFSIDRFNNSLLLNTLKGLSGLFNNLNDNPVIFETESSKKILLIEKIIEQLESNKVEEIPWLVYNTMNNFKVKMIEEDEFFKIDVIFHDKLKSYEQNQLNQLYQNINIIKIPLTEVKNCLNDFNELDCEKTFIPSQNVVEHNEPFYHSWKSEYNIKLIKQDTIEFRISYDYHSEILVLGIIEDEAFFVSNRELNEVVIFYKKSTSLEMLSNSLRDEYDELSEAIEVLIDRRNVMLASFYNTLNAAGKDEFKSSHLKVLESAFREENLKHEREKLQESIKSEKRYSYNWFRSYLNLLLTFENKQDTTQQKSIAFQEIKQHIVNGEISNKYFLLRGASSLIPVNIEDFEDFSITLVHKNKKKVNIDVEGVSKRGQDLITFCRRPIEQNIIDGFKDVLQIRISFSPVLDLLELLKNAFFNESFIDEWNDINERLPSLKFIYGPPGTGKTTTICNQIEQVIQENHRAKFLLLTPTNKAADVVCKKIIENDIQYRNGLADLDDNNVFRMPVSMVRIGRQTNDELGDYDEDLYKDSIDKNTLDNMHLVASTIHRIPYYSIIDEASSSYIKLFKLENYWDYVVFDEASMTNLPYIVFVIMAIHKFNPDAKFIIAGDPKQIPPIVNVTDNELEDIDIQDENIYTMMGINSFNPNQQIIRDGDEILNLTTQYRSVKPIGQLFSDLSYNNLLNHHRNGINHKAKELPEKLKKLINNNVTFIDLPLDVDNSIFRIDKLFYSSYHTYSAILVAEIVKYFDSLLNESESWTIGLIAPYKAQAVILNKLITSFGISDKLKIYSDTVHGFQGDECDIILFIANPNNIRYTGHHKSLLSKEYIYNVAISRAKDYLVILHPFDVIAENPYINQLRESYIKNFGENAIKQHREFEEVIFNQPDFIEKNSFITGHDNVNIFGQVEMKYFIKANENAIDIQLRKFE